MRGSTALLVLALVAILCGVGWLAFRGWDATTSPSGPDALSTAEPPNDVVATEFARLEPLPAEDPGEHRASRAPVAAPPDTARREQAAEPGTSRFAWKGRFERPDGEEEAPERTTVTLRGADGLEHRGLVRRVTSVMIEDLAAGTYEVEVRAKGYEHRPQTIVVGVAEAGEIASDPLVLWPLGWVAVVVRTPDGRPLAALAGELWMEPKRVFSGAFGVRTRATPPDSGAEPGSGAEPDGAKPLARFHGTAPRPMWEVSDVVIGSLEFVEQPTVWVGLEVFGTSAGWVPLAPGAREAAFVLDASAFESRFASLVLQVVDAGSGEGAADARITLTAEDSSLRRKEHEDVQPAEDGLATLARIVPGRYEVTIRRGQTFHQQFVDLGAGEQRDLGRIGISLGLGFDVRVVDERGRSTAAALMIGTYRRAGNVNELYPSLTSRCTQDDGTGRLPQPTGPSIVRAVVPDAFVGSSCVRSADVLIDPERLPNGPLVLVVYVPQDVRFEIGNRSAAVVEVLDELELVVESMTPAQAASKQASLVPGRYRARLVASDSRVICERAFDVAGAPVTVALP